MKLRLASFCLVSLLAAGGCQAPPPPPPPVTDERPRCSEDALWLEGQANKERARAYRSFEQETKRKYFDRAIERLRSARALYDNELADLEHDATKEHQIPQGRREALQIEIDRLTAQLNQVITERPVY